MCSPSQPAISASHENLLEIKILGWNPAFRLKKKSEHKAKILYVVIIQVIQIHIRNLEKYSIKRSLIYPLLLRNFGSWQININAKGLNFLSKIFYVISMISFSLSGIALN